MFYKMIHRQAAIPYQPYIQCSTYLNSRYSNTMKFCLCYVIRIFTNNYKYQSGTTYLQKQLALHP